MSDADRFLREAEVAAITTLSRAQRWRLELRCDFPARVKLGGRTVAWSAREIAEWMESRPRAKYLPRGAVLGPPKPPPRGRNLRPIPAPRVVPPPA